MYSSNSFKSIPLIRPGMKSGSILMVYHVNNEFSLTIDNVVRAHNRIDKLLFYA